MGSEQAHPQPGGTHRPSSPSEFRSESPPPPYGELPPSMSTEQNDQYLHVNQTTASFYSQPTSFSWSDQDPRGASTESLLPRTPTSQKRTLLLIYIHGFMGNETSFQSFPAHVHNEVTQLLAGTHVVHTKIYPRYRSRKAIEFARDNFSNWLSPHESPQTDVILLGHSMGGLLSAEVALMPPPPQNNPDLYLHRILGTINFDTPFLGMHPSVVKDGLSSLFRGAEEPASTQGGGSSAPETTQAGPNTENTTLSPSQSLQNAPGSPTSYFSGPPTSVNDSNYNPPFPNDVNLPVRRTWESALHFMTKHSDNLSKATTAFVKSHIEFGSAMADYKSLKARYHRIRALEDVDDRNTSASSNISGSPKRVRFVNFYTASTGRPVQPKLSAVDGSNSQHEKQSLEKDMQSLDLSIPDQHESAQLNNTQASNNTFEDDPSKTPDMPGRPIESLNAERVSVEEAEIDKGMDTLDPTPYAEDEETGTSPKFPMASEDGTSVTEGKVLEKADAGDDHTSLTNTETTISLPPIPEEPTKPEPFDASLYVDKDARKLAEKDYQRRTKVYSQAVKDREKAIKDRRKLLEKREKTLRKEHDKLMKEDKKSHEKQEKDRLKAEALRMKNEAARLRGEDVTSEEQNQEDSQGLSQKLTNQTEKSSKEKPDKPDKPKKDKKFCMLPPKGADGSRDPTWVRVFMKDVDVVGAHCGLFFYDKPHYNKFVVDIGQEVLQWITHAEKAERMDLGS